jgi:hypothetical protein
MKRHINLVSLIFSFLTIIGSYPLLGYTKGLFIGSIQFPSALKSVPDIRIFCGGNKITCEKDNAAKRISFMIPEDKHRTIVPLVIAESVEFEVVKESNTIAYLKIPAGKPYKLFMLELQKVARKIDPESRSHVYHEDDFTYEWNVRVEKNLFANGRIPDDSVVVYFNPDYIATLSGGNKFELPRIMMKKNLLALAGSEEKLHDFSTSLILSSLDLNAIHAHVESQVTQEYHRTLITLVT